MKINILTIIISFLSCSTSLKAQETTVFQNGEDGFLCYRIPAIVKAPNGDLLAFCEARKQSCSDHGNIRIVQKRSTDNGTTWGKLEEVASNGTNQLGNPAPVVDLTDKKHPNGRIFMFYNTGTASEHEVREGKAIREIWYKTSVDNGKIWSKPINITPSVHLGFRMSDVGGIPKSEIRNPKSDRDWRSYANTPGHGLQLTEGKYKGRIFIAANHSEGVPKPNSHDYLAHGFYSDNHGKTWKITPSVNYPSSNESTAAELSNGGVLMNIRNQSGDSKNRILAFSQNAGEKWDTVYIEKQLPDPVCEGSMINYTTNKGENVLLFSNLEHASKRENLTLKVSADDGKTWRTGKVICKGSSAYSDLVIQADNQIGVLYEKDNYTKIVYQKLSYEELFAATKPTDTWKGFERVSFKIGKHDAYYVKPAKALEGKPWIWRASFPDWHTDMDSILLTKGFHVVFVHVDNEYGSPYAMQIWDKTYNYLTDSCDFAPKMALEGVSRGGLYVYAWAKRNPDKVTCIYNEAPVCDAKSWPGGKGKGVGNKDNWAQYQQIFKMSEEEAVAFKDNPIDNLAGLASFKVPLLHVISNSDKIVPSEENTYLLVQRYTTLGGPATIYPVTEGPQNLEGHHFPINKADEWADFILKNSFPVKKPLPNRDYFKIRNGLKNSFQAITENKKVTVGFLGGSITYNKGWRTKTSAYLKEAFPETDFRFIAAGIPSLGSLAHAFRVQRDLLDSGKIDLLFVEAAVNDVGTDSLTQIRGLEGIVRHAKTANPNMDIVLMSFADPNKTQNYDKGKEPIEVKNHELVAEHYGLPSINLAKEVWDKMQNKEFSWADDFKDLHPSVFGQELYYSTIKSLLLQGFNASNSLKNNTLRTDFLNKSSFANGTYHPVEKAQLGEHWVLHPHWKPTEKLETREGFVNVPMIVSTTPESTFSLNFKGTAVGLSVVSGPDTGIISYSIDDAPFKDLDLYTRWSSALYLPWYVVLGADLAQGSHVLKVKLSAEKNPKSKGTACRIVHFLVNE